ncbi:MAG: ATP-binding cassette domain-containing protein [Lachnospiraceae bacterium]|nr:ATP-binding cassette domain-containing protein [Lachnospiraceae bacterium]
MASYKKESIMAPLFKMLEAIFELLVPFVVAAIIDNGIGSNDTGYVIRMALLMILIAMIGAGFAITAQYFAAKTATGTAYEVRRDLNSTILNMSKQRYREIGKSTLLTRMTSDVNQLQSAINMFLRLFLRSPFIVLGAFIMSLIIDVKMSLIIGAVIIVLAIIVYLVMRIVLPRIKTIQSKVDGLTTRIRNDYGGAKVIRGFVIQDEEDDKFKDQLEDLYKRQLGAGRFSNVLNPLTFAFVNLGIILILYFGGKRIEIGELSTGEVVALLNYMSQILVELVKLANLIVLLMKGIPSARRIAEVIDAPDSNNAAGTEGDVANMDNATITEGDVANTDNATNTEGDVAKTDDAPIVKSIKSIAENNLSDVSKGDKIGIIGPTGCGKSLLLSVYMDSLEDKSGVGYVPQDDSFFTGSIAENILLKAHTNEDFDYALNMSSFKEVVDKKGGVDEPLTKGASNLSTGQQKRLALARALYKKPKMLLMDDVTNPLDMITEKQVLDNVLNSDMSVIIASQKVSAVMKTDKIIVIDYGNVVDVGTHAELIERCELYSKMYYAQFPDMKAERRKDA